MNDPVSLRQQFIPIEGLRGYLALWVAVGHGLQTSGYLALPGPLKVLLQGEEAVNLFIVISGFVITHLLLTARESYGPYLVRRFFRLYPLFVVACVAGYFSMLLWPALVQDVPWRDMAGWPRYADTVLEIASQSRDHFWPHALLHATMLHGLVPMEWLPVASKTLLPAAWSISLEWQFYLVAPLVLLALKRPSTTLVLALVVVLAVALYRRGLLGSYSGASALFISAGYFALGIVSRLGFARLQGLLRVGPVSAGQAALALLLLLFTLTPGHLALYLWLPFLCYLAVPTDNAVFRGLHHAMASATVLRIGAMSYSIYLAHRPIQVLFGWLLLQWQPQASQPAMLASQALAIVVTVAVSVLLWNWVEVPGQALGRQLARRWAARTPARLASSTPV